jgi:hypothetical protein
MRLLGVTAQDALKEILAPVFAPAIPMLAAMFLTRASLGSDSVLSLLLSAASGLLVFAFGYLAQRINSAERDLLRDLCLETLRQTRSYLRISKPVN